MFDRVKEFLVVTTNNLKALEEVSLWICNILNANYFVRVEKFPSTTLYRFYIHVEEKLDKKTIKGLKDFVSLTNIELIQ